jgi:DNA-binding beta-propeller fold protein YncE
VKYVPLGLERKGGLKTVYLTLFVLGIFVLGLTVAVAADAEGITFQGIRLSDAEDLGTPIKTVAVTNGGYGLLSDGTPVTAFIAKGNPGMLFVFNTRTRDRLFSGPLPGEDDTSFSTIVASDGTVYVGGTAGGLFSWKAGGKTIEHLGTADRVIMCLQEGPDKRIYMGTFNTGRLFIYDPKSRKMEDKGSVVAGEQYARSIAFSGKDAYIGVGTRPHLIRWNPATDSRTEIELPPELRTEGTIIRGLTVAGNRLFGFGADSLIFVLDTGTDKVIKTIPDGLADGAIASPERDGKVYFARKGGKLWEYDLATDTFKESPGFKSTSYTRDFGWLDTGTGEPSLVTVSWGADIWAYNPKAQAYQGWKLDVEGQGVTIQAMEKGPDERLYMSGYPGSVGARYDTTAGTTVNFALGQAEGIGFLKKQAYFGIYPHAILMQMDITADSPKAARLFEIGGEQDRPFAFETDGSSVYIGTIAGYGKLGGSLTAYNPETNAREVFRNIVPNQSIVRLVYRNGLIYGTTTVWGGLGIAPTEQAAKVFVWDVKKKQLLKSVTPEHPAFDSIPKAVSGLCFGPDGKLWGAWQGTLFRMDPKTLRVEAVKTLSPSSWDVSHSWKPIVMTWGPGGLLYSALGGRLTVTDPKTLDSVQLDTAQHPVFGKDGFLYYTSGSHLYRMKVTKTR